ncbi:MAG: homing endonuclease associated repeat-containing protein [Planctomycetota bacterium]|jgi:enamine deaminase RidA (YjgF/YER057c/UK114 family)
MPAKSSSSGWSKEKIVERVKALYAKGEDLSYNRMARGQQGLLAAANYHFGSWAEAVNAAGVDYATEVRKIPKWSKEKIIGAIQQAHEEGADLSWTNVTKRKQYSALAYAAIRDNQFGSWDAALEAAGLDPADVRRYESWHEEKILRRVKERSRARKPLNSKAMQDEDSKLFNAALNYFGGWDKALEAAGIAPDDVYKRRRWSADIIKEEVKALNRAGEDLAAPNMRKNHSSLYSAACKYFGSWTAAREACGIRRNFHKKE